jgi:hypothetical protein
MQYSELLKMAKRELADIAGPKAFETLEGVREIALRVRRGRRRGPRGEHDA